MTNLDELSHEATNIAESIELTKTIKFLIGNVETNKYCNDYDRSRSGGGGGDNDDDEIELMQLTNDFRHHHQYGLSSLPHGTIELYDYINYHNMLSFKKNNTINNKYTNFNTISCNENDINNNDNIDNNNITTTDNITNDINTITNDTNSNDKYDYKQLCLLDIPSIMIPIEILKFLKLNLQSIVKFEIFRHYNYLENYLAVITFSSNTNGKEFYKIYHNTLLCSLNNYNNKSNNYYCYLYPIKYINYYDSNKIITNDNHHRGTRYNTTDHNNNDDDHDSFDNIERRRKYSSPLLPLHMTNNVKTSIYNNNNDDKNKDHRHYRSNYQHHSSNNLLSNHDENHNNQNNNHSFIAIDEDYSVDDYARNAINIFRGISPTNLYYQKHHDHRDDNNDNNAENQNYDDVGDIIIKHSIIQSSNHSNENKFIVNLTDVR